MPRKIEPRVLARCWVHAHEEDSETEIVYRPAGWALPPSRGRSGFDLHADGRLVSIHPGPTDRPEEAPGRWRLEKGRLVLEETPAGGATRSFRIVSATRNRLVLRRVT
jgi:hypothetical protein